MSEDDITKYPKIVEGIEDARAEWEKALGVSIYVISGQATAFQTKIDIRDDLESLDKHTVGAWVGAIDTIVLDSSFIDTREKARMITLHEMGHYFGIPHLTSEHASLFTEAIDYETLVMYPMLTEKNINSKLTETEIRIAYGQLFK